MKNNYSKIFSTILISFFGISIVCVLFFLFARAPKSGQFHGIYGLIVVGVIFTILAVAGELSKKESQESTGNSIIYKISLLYFVIMALISLLYILRWAESLSWFYIFHISSFLSLSVALIAASTSTVSESEVNTKKVDLSRQMRELRSRISILCLQYSDAPWHRKLVRCQEEIGLFDTDVSVPADLEITRLVGKLEKTLQKKKEKEEEARLAMEEERERVKQAEEKKLVEIEEGVTLENGVTLEETEENEDEPFTLDDQGESFTLENEDESFTLDDQGEGEENVSEDEEIPCKVESWIVEEDEGSDSFDIPLLIEELRQYIQQRSAEAKKK